MASPTDIMPAPEQVTALLKSLPGWALAKAEEIVYPTCPTDFVLYSLPGPRKAYLTLCVAEALVEAAGFDRPEWCGPCGCFELSQIDGRLAWRCNDCKRVLGLDGQEVA